jgi:hypothetical protein
MVTPVFGLQSFSVRTLLFRYPPSQNQEGHITKRIYAFLPFSRHICEFFRLEWVDRGGHMANLP